MTTQTKQTFYYWKSNKDKDWIPYSIAHNNKEIKIVEKSIKRHIKNSNGRLIFKKEQSKTEVTQ